MEAACSVGLVSDLATLRSFLYGRLWTAGVMGAVAAASVCARAGNPRTTTSLIRTTEAELDARTPSPAARAASRDQGGHILGLAHTITASPLLDALGRETVREGQRPHYPAAAGIVAAVAGATPGEAAEAAAYSTIAGPAFAAQTILGLPARLVSELGVEMAPEVRRLAEEAAETALRPLSRMPAFGAPVLEYLAEEHVAGPARVFAS